MVCIYGPTGVGKTTSIIQTSPMPILYVQTEARSLKPSLDAAARQDLDIDVAIYEDYGGLIEFVTQPKNSERHKTIVVDSYSHLMSVGLSTEIEDQAHEARTEKEKAVEVKPIDEPQPKPKIYISQSPQRTQSKIRYF